MIWLLFKIRIKQSLKLIQKASHIRGAFLLLHKNLQYEHTNYQSKYSRI